MLFFLMEEFHYARKLRYSVVACLASAISMSELYLFPSLEQGTLGHLPFKELTKGFYFKGVV